MSVVTVSNTETVIEVIDPSASVVNVTAGEDTVIIDPPDLAYCNAYDTTDQAVTSVTASKKIDVNSTSLAYKISRSDGTFTFQQAGTYSISLSVQYENSATSIVESAIYLRKNNQVVDYSSSYSSVPNSHGGIPGRLITTVPFVMQFVPNDTLEFWWHADNINCKIHTIAASTSPSAPVAPGVIITIVQVS